MKIFNKKIDIVPKTALLIIIYVMVFTAFLTGLKTFHHESPYEMQKNIASNIVRLHIIANSDSDEDQSLKLRVRDNILSEMQTITKKASSAKEAEALLTQNKTLIRQSALRFIHSKGYNYDVKVDVTDRYFPVKAYGDLVFPQGTYRALCVEIGKAKGKNWWCVLFPSLCFVNETYAVVPDSSKERLKNSLSEEEYTYLEKSTPAPTASPAPKVETHSAVYDWFSKTFR